MQVQAVECITTCVYCKKSRHIERTALCHNCKGSVLTASEASELSLKNLQLQLVDVCKRIREAANNGEFTIKIKEEALTKNHKMGLELLNFRVYRKNGLDSEYVIDWS